MPVTRFPARADNIADRMIGFMAHLRLNGMNVGVEETHAALTALATINAGNSHDVKMALKAICADDAKRFADFDDLFRAYWFNKGRERKSSQNTKTDAAQKSQIPSRAFVDETSTASGTGERDSPDNGEGEADADGEGKLIASRRANMRKMDLRRFMQPDDLAEAARVAERIANAIRDRRSRRRKQSRRGAPLDMRRIARRSVARGGEPLDLFRRTRPERPVHLVALLDVSGSMTVYARVFLAFLKGLMSADQKTEAYLFHTRLVHISDALRDGDTLRAVNRLSLMAQGFGGGTKIASNLASFNDQYAARHVNSRTVVVILSDGYDTDNPEKLSAELTRLKRRGCRIIWLNPLKGWKNYEPVAAGMTAALPHLDLFASATTLDDLAALEPHLGGV